MSLESEMEKINTNLERVGIALENLVANPSPDKFDLKPNPEGGGGFDPIVETKIVEPEVKKVSKEQEQEQEQEPIAKEKPAKKKNRTVRARLTGKQVQIFAREKIAEYAEKDPKLKVKIKEKIAELGASMITDLDQEGLIGLDKFLNEL